VAEMGLLHKHEPYVSLQLYEHNFHTIKKVEPGTTIVCEKGSLYLTQSGIYEDYALRSGQQVVLNGKGTVLIEATSESHLCVLYPN
jgi:hypothetical protein